MCMHRRSRVRAPPWTDPYAEGSATLFGDATNRSKIRELTASDSALWRCSADTQHLPLGTFMALKGWRRRDVSKELAHTDIEVPRNEHLAATDSARLLHDWARPKFVADDESQR